ncbi:MAG: TetR/AcrR family transcriptional regulator, partial [Mycobacterium sp.]
ALRAQELNPERIVRHTRQVEADFADAVAERLTRGRSTATATPNDPLRVTVTARCISAAVFGAMEVWMLGEDRSLAELARMCRTALDSLRDGIPSRVSSVSS